jgi:Fur family zinc uptake transcriptional regulator
MNVRTHPAMEAQLERAAAICTEHGTQLTPLRRQVLQLVLDADGPSTAYQLLDRLKAQHKSAAPPTIYRALDFLLEQGLIHKIERLNAFISCVDTNHAHHAAQFLICRQCGKVAEIEDHSVAQALKRAAEKQGFRPEAAIIELSGICAGCIGAPASSRVG